MGQNSSLKDKLEQHQFDYRPGAWESMESLLDTSLPSAKVPKSSNLFTKWFRWLGAAAVISALTFWGFNSSSSQKDIENSASSPTEQTLDKQSNTTEATPLNATNKVEKKANVLKENDKVQNNTFSSMPATTPNEYHTVSPANVTKKSVQHAEPVDDSKVYRENSNHKKPHHTLDEQGKAPAASDLHHN